MKVSDFLNSEHGCIRSNVCTQSLRHAQLFVTPRTVARQAPLSRARILGWVAASSSRRSFQHREWTLTSCTSCIGRQILYLLSHNGKPQWWSPKAVSMSWPLETVFLLRKEVFADVSWGSWNEIIPDCSSESSIWETQREDRHRDTEAVWRQTLVCGSYRWRMPEAARGFKRQGNSLP